MKKILSITGTVTGWFLTLLGIVIVILQITDLMTKLFWLTLIALFLMLAAFISSIVILSKEIRFLKGRTLLERNCYIEKYDEQRNNIIITKYMEPHKIGSLVTVYYFDDVPQRIGLGVIENQQNSFQTIIIKKIFSEYDDIWNNIKANKSNYLKKAYVVPIFFEEYIDEYKSESWLTKLSSGGGNNGNT